jgi:hypothetical protein
MLGVLAIAKPALKVVAVVVTWVRVRGIYEWFEETMKQAR